MSLDQIITVQIDRNTTTPDQAGFGTPLIAGYFPTSIFSERTRSYGSLVEMTTDGFKASDPVYIAASDCFAQNPSPPVVKIGRRAGAPQQTITITPPASPIEGEVFTVSVSGYADSAFAARTVAHDKVSITADNGDTPTSIVTKLKAAFGLLNSATGPAGDWSWTAAATTLVIEADNTDATMNGLLFGVAVSDNLSIVDNTPNPATSLADDLAAIQLYDPDWYGLVIDSNSHAEIDLAAAFADSNEKLFVAQTQDSAVVTTTAAADTTSVAAGLASDRTMLFFHRLNPGAEGVTAAECREYVCAAMVGRALPETPGAITWAYKQLQSVSAQNLNTTEQLRCEDKNVNTFTTLAGVNVTRYGEATSGEYMDVMRGTDWLAARIQEDVYALLIQNDKVPYTDAGIQAVRGVILGRLQEGVANSFLSGNPEPACTVPRAADVSAADKGSRTLNNVTFRATLAGAVHKVAIEGELNL